MVGIDLVGLFSMSAADWLAHLKNVAAPLVITALVSPALWWGLERSLSKTLRMAEPSDNEQ